jgi:hypothetical protein
LVSLALSDRMIHLDSFDQKFLDRGGYLKLRPCFALMVQYCTLMYLCLRAGLALKFFFLEKILGSWRLRFCFQTEVHTILACSDYCLKKRMNGKTICSIKIAYSNRGWCFSAGALSRDFLLSIGFCCIGFLVIVV